MSVDITLQDGVSGLATGAQEGKALLTGYCSKGVPGKAYYIGASTDISDLLGAGPLVDRLKDVFSVTDDAVVIAVPVATSTFEDSLGRIEISPAGITGEENFDVVLSNFGEGHIHKRAKNLIATGKYDTGIDFPMNDGEHYHYNPDTGSFEVDYYIEHVSIRVRYDSVTGAKDFMDNFVEGQMVLTDPTAQNVSILSWKDGNELTLTEGIDYTCENRTHFRLINETLDTQSVARYSSTAFSISLSYSYSEYEQGNSTIALPKYIQNVQLSPGVLYHIDYDPERETNILTVDAPMPENLTCTWESEVAAAFEKSREAAPDLTMVGIGKKACTLVLKFGESGGSVPVFSGGLGGVIAGQSRGPVIETTTNWSVARYQVSYDGGETYSGEKNVPYDGRLDLGAIGVSVIVPETPLIVSGDRYALEIPEPAVSVVDTMSAIESPLEKNDVEFVAVCGAMPSDAWSVFAQKADELWQKHRPTFFLLEYRTPANDETIDNWVSVLLAERVQFAHPFLACCVAYGNVSGNTRNLMGLLAGRLLSIPVMRSIGRVRDGGLATVQLPDGYNESHQQTLEDAGYITAKTITGLKNPYFGSARTLAEDTSDFRYIEILRVVFKACRLARIRALNSIHDEAGDPLLGSDASGVAYLKSNIESAVGTMKTAAPQEIVDFVISIPKGQDIVNNGLRLGLRLIGIPIIRELEIFASYTYAGSTFDPRLEAVS